jgi:hypothetical protein
MGCVHGSGMGGTCLGRVLGHHEPVSVARVSRTSTGFVHGVLVICAGIEWMSGHLIGECEVRCRCACIDQVLGHHEREVMGHLGC